MQNHDATSKGEANICLGGGKNMFVRPVLVMFSYVDAVSEGKTTYRVGNKGTTVGEV